MIKRPKSDETEEDILRMQNEFLSHRAKNPKLQPAAQCVKVTKGKYEKQIYRYLLIFVKYFYH